MVIRTVHIFVFDGFWDWGPSYAIAQLNNAFRVLTVVAPTLDRSCAALQLHRKTDCLPRSLPELYRELHKAAANRCPSGQAAIPRTEAFLWWTPESPANANSRSVPGGKPAFSTRRRCPPPPRTCLRRECSSLLQSPTYSRWSAAARRTCWTRPSAASREYALEYFLPSHPAGGRRTWASALFDTSQRCQQSAPVQTKCQGSGPTPQNLQRCRAKNKIGRAHV